MTNVFPAIWKAFPVAHKENMALQKNNAKSHSLGHDTETLSVRAEESRKIVLNARPDNSSDFNIFDIVFFSALNRFQYQDHSCHMKELTSAVEKVIENSPSYILSISFESS